MRNLTRILRHPRGLIAIVMLALLMVMAFSAPLLYPDGPWSMAGGSYVWPFQEGATPLGTDAFGRDLLAGVLYGSQITIVITLSAAAAALFLGVLMGVVAGYYGGLIDDVLMRVCDATLTIPGFLFAVVIVGLLSPSLVTIAGAIALVSWPSIARLVRAEVMKLRRIDFVLAARVCGVSDLRIILVHVLPNCFAPIAVAASFLVATAIIIESGLAFLGLSDPDVISWGSIMGAGRSSIRSAWYITLVPGTAIVLTVLAFNMLGDAINDVLDPARRNK